MREKFMIRMIVAVTLSMAIAFSSDKGRCQPLPKSAFRKFVESVPVNDVARRGKSNKHKIIVEKAGEITVSCSWNQGDLKFELTDPLGNIVDSTSDSNNYTAEYTKSVFPEGIIQADFVLAGDFPPGIWTMEIKTEDETEYGIDYTIQVYLRDPALMTFYRTDKDVYKTNDRVIISALLQSNSMPVLNATVRAVMAWEHDIIDTLILRDDGLHYDSLANDGIYAFPYDVLDQQGDYYVHISSEKSGRSPFARRDEFALMFIVNNSSIIGPVYEKSLDIDGNGFYDSLIVGVDFDLACANDYKMRASLYDKNDSKISAMRVCDDFPNGTRTIEFSFDGSAIFEHGVDGPYYLKELTLSDSCDNVPLLDSSQIAYMTKPYDYRDFEHGPIFITGNHKISEQDIDNDGLIDSLVLIFEVELKKQCKCLWTGFLKSDDNSHNCSRAESKGIYGSGISEIRLSFSGEHLRLCPYDGIYSILVTVIDRESDRSSTVNFKFKTAEYKHTDFE